MMGGIIGKPSNYVILKKIKFINFTEFQNLNSFSTDVILTSLVDIDISKSLMVYISHAWSHDFKTIPDNDNNHKLKLCQRGIESIRSIHASNLDNCYVWIDFLCLQNTSVPLKDFSLLLQFIMSHIDFVFTPILNTSNSFHSLTVNELTDYKVLCEEQDAISPDTNTSDSSTTTSKTPVNSTIYLNNIYCIIELLYSQLIPFQYNLRKRDKLLTTLKHYYMDKHRPHIVYTLNEWTQSTEPICLKYRYDELLSIYRSMDVKDNSYNMMIAKSMYSKVLVFTNCYKLGYYGQRNSRGQKHGYGVYTYDNSDIYEGEWSLSRYHGQGKYLYSNGTVYDGHWANGMKCGEGAIVYCDGSVYNGEWKDDMKHGQGVYINESNNRYEGDFVCDKMCGVGKMTFYNGDIYDGQWENDRPHGYGIMSYANKDVYIGPWANGHMHGEGKYTYENGDVYEGGFVNSEKHGHGICVSPNGDVYDGMWMGDKKHGRGECTCNNELFIGEWKHGVWCGEVE